MFRLVLTNCAESDHPVFDDFVKILQDRRPERGDETGRTTPMDLPFSGPTVPIAPQARQASSGSCSLS